jgi:hypothetical protein
VQFSHFSVKEYLTSTRLASSSQDVSRYHISLEPAHAILAQACVTVLLQFPDRDEEDDVENDAPLALYAAEHWARHAQFEDVASRIKGMEYLFDLDKPYFATWRQLHDIDTPPADSPFHHMSILSEPGLITPLYYAALCGFSNIAEQLIVRHPEHVNALGGCYMTPAVAALAGRHLQLAELLHHNGSSVEPVRDETGWSPLQCAANRGFLDIVQVLIDYGVDVSSHGDGDASATTPLHTASWGEYPGVVRFLLDHGADPNIRTLGKNLTPLHFALQEGRIETARILVEHGANLEAEDWQGRTPLVFASGNLSEEQRDEIVELLSTK